MAVGYTQECKFPLMASGTGNWGAVFNGVLVSIDQGYEITLTNRAASLAAFSAVTLFNDGGNSRMRSAKADDVATMPAIGIAPYSVPSNAQGKVRIGGWIENSAWNFTPGLPIYVSEETAGSLTQVRPEKYPQMVAIAKTATVIYLLPQLDFWSGVMIGASVKVGQNAGKSCLASGSVFIGNNAGKNETEANKLHIANNESESLVEGDFSTRELQVNGSVVVEELATGDLVSQESVSVQDGGFVLGDPLVDGSWRFIRDGEELLVQKREAGYWITKDTFLA